MTTLSDLYHYFGEDLATSNTGGLLLATDDIRAEQRVLRRLLTNPATSTTPGDYIWEPTYGAGLPSYIGKTLDKLKIQAICIAQMLLEDVVAKSPVPVVTISQLPNDFSAIQVQVSFTSQPTDTPIFLSFTVSK